MQEIVFGSQEEFLWDTQSVSILSLPSIYLVSFSRPLFILFLSSVSHESNHYELASAELVKTTNQRRHQLYTYVRTYVPPPARWSNMYEILYAVNAGEKNERIKPKLHSADVLCRSGRQTCRSHSKLAKLFSLSLEANDDPCSFASATRKELLSEAKVSVLCIGFATKLDGIDRALNP